MYQTPSQIFVRTAMWIAALSIVPTAFLSLEAAAAQDQDQGMLLLHSQEQNDAVDEVLPRLNDHGCALWRRGSVAGTQGNLDLGSPDRFVLLACASEILDSDQRRGALASILNAGADVLAVEGPIVHRNEDKAERDVQNERAYILKISRYNNLDPDGRDRDLDMINALADERADAWKTEALVSGARAVGIPTPDEVVVIYYDDPQQGERFRSRNADILEQIGDFNRSHLIDFSYISALPGR